MSEFSKLFFSDHSPVIVRTFTVIEDDYQLVKTVFPEYGFLQYFPGLFFKLLAEELRKHNIKNALNRLEHPHLATVPGLVSNLDLAFNAARSRNVRWGAGSVRKEPPHLQRIIADLVESCSDSGCRDKDKEGKEKGGEG